MKHIRKCLLISIALGILLSCTGTPKQVSQKNLPPSKVALVAKDSATVHLITEDINREIPLGDYKLSQRRKEVGSGFFIEHDKVATNIHCVAGVTKLQAKLVGTETFYDIEGVLASDPRNDIVILKIFGKGPEPLSLSGGDNFQVGERVFAIGNPKGGAEGQITLGNFYNKRDGDGWLRLRIKFYPNNSGGPVLNTKMEVIGIAVGSSNVIKMGYAIPSNALKELLNNLKPVESLTQWQQKNPIRAYDYYTLAQALLSQAATDPKKKQVFYKKATEMLDTAITLYPEFSNAYFTRGTAQTELGEHQKAIEDYIETIKRIPDHAMAYNNLGTAKLELEKYEEAVDASNKAIKLIPNNPIFYNNRGWAWYQWGKSEAGQEKHVIAKSLYQAAIDDYDKALELSPSSLRPLKNKNLAKKALTQ